MISSFKKFKPDIPLGDDQLPSILVLQDASALVNPLLIFFNIHSYKIFAFIVSKICFNLHVTLCQCLQCNNTTNRRECEIHYLGKNWKASFDVYISIFSSF